MRIKSFFVATLVSVCALSSLPTLPCSAYQYEEAVVETEYVSLEAEEDSYVFPSNGYVQGISVYGITESGEKVKIEEGVQYSSKDEDIASVYQDSVRAESKGNTSVIAEYNGIALEIPIVVENEIDLDALEAALLEQAGCSLKTQEDYLQTISEPKRLPSNRTAQEILDKAAAMKNVRWTPTQDLLGYNNFKFQKDTVHTGIPYSKLKQVDEIDFIDKLNNDKDFYTNGTYEGVLFPTYGVDCSGYVSFAFGIDRMNTGSMITALKNGTGKIVKVGNYNPKSLKETELYDAYAKLAAANAVVHEGHAILVLSNDPSSKQLVVYETKGTVPIVSIYKYSSLWNDRYMPFKLANMLE